MIFNPLTILIVNLIPFLCFIFYQPLIIEFKKIVDAEITALYFIFIIIISSVITYVFSQRQRLRINTLSIHLIKNLFKVHRLMLMFTALLLLIIVFSGMLSFEGNFYSSKANLSSFNGLRILIHLKNILIPLCLARVISSYMISSEENQKNTSFSISRTRKFYLFSLNKYPLISLFIIIIVLLSGLYSFYFGERMAFYETLISVLLPLNLYGIIRLSLKQIMGISIGFIFSFMAFESSRNFYIQYIERGRANIDWDFLVFAFQYTLDRFFLYYMDCVNKLIFVISNHLGGTGGQLRILLDPLATLGLVDLSYFQKNKYLDTGYFTEQLTNYGAATVLYLDFGWLGLLFIVVAFIILCFLFKACLKGKFEFLPYYNILMISFFELPRIPYWYFSRFTIPLLFYMSLFFFTISIPVRKKYQ